MSKRAIQTEAAPTPIGPYSQGLVAGDFVFVAGQGPIVPGTRQKAGTSIEEQTEQTLKNVQAILEAAGASMADVVKVTAHLSDLSLFARFNAVYSRFFPDPKPVRTTVGSQLLDILVEIDAIAYIGNE
jgi:2-iminobutanoate/2-iminopropanoate deaminase